jgi:nitrogen fixation protein FixH
MHFVLLFGLLRRKASLLVDESRLEEVRQAESRHRLFWVGLIVALLSAQVLLMFVAVYATVADGSFAVEPNYYQQSMKWDATMAQRRHNEHLGWQVELSLADQASIFGDRKVFCRLVDRDGIPLDGAVIELVAFAHARGNDRLSASLTAAGDGRYEATMRINRPGKWEFRLAVQRGAETFTHTELRDVSLRGGAI